MSAPPVSADPAVLKVLDVGTQVAGPFAATILADLGAEVIKVERPVTGDPLRLGGMSPRWQVEGRNKRSVTLNLGVPDGQVLLRRLAGWADVLVENFRPGTMDRWGLGYDDLARVHPRLVYASVSGFGATGPYAGRSGYDHVGSAFGGLTAVTGYADRAPVLPALFVTDHVTGLFTAIGILEGVRRRDAAGGTGKGTRIDGALYESIVRFAGADIADYSLTGFVRARVGGEPVADDVQESPLPYAYRTRDGRWLSIYPVTDQQLGQLRRLVGEPELDDSRFEGTAGRARHAADWHRIVASWAAVHDFAELWDALGRTDVPASPLNSVPELVEDPQVRARDSVVRVENAEGSPVLMPAVIPRLAGGATIRWAGQPLGASNEAVYCGLLGMSAGELGQLAASGIV
jgi:crotonobetainyl-CoA:carnitine CoA-transferase CaiB-like acyl-CoA transferase